MKLGGNRLVVYNPVHPDADRLWDADAERFGSAGIDRKLIRSGLLHRDVTRLGSAHDLRHHIGGTAPQLREVEAIGHQTARLDPLRVVEHARQAGVKREFGKSAGGPG